MQVTTWNLACRVHLQFPDYVLYISQNCLVCVKCVYSVNMCAVSVSAWLSIKHVITHTYTHTHHGLTFYWNIVLLLLDKVMCASLTVPYGTPPGAHSVDSQCGKVPGGSVGGWFTAAHKTSDKKRWTRTLYLYGGGGLLEWKSVPSASSCPLQPSLEHNRQFHKANCSSCMIVIRILFS